MNTQQRGIHKEGYTTDPCLIPSQLQLHPVCRVVYFQADVSLSSSKIFRWCPLSQTCNTFVVFPQALFVNAIESCYEILEFCHCYNVIFRVYFVLSVFFGLVFPQGLHILVFGSLFSVGLWSFLPRRCISYNCATSGHSDHRSSSETWQLCFTRILLLYEKNDFRIIWHIFWHFTPTLLALDLDSQSFVGPWCSLVSDHHV